MPATKCRCCEKKVSFDRPRRCPECGHVFQGNGWDGIDAHWRASENAPTHEAVMPYVVFWNTLCYGHGGKPAIDEVRALNLRVARIVEATNHPNADRLYVLKVDLGTEGQRQIVAGVKQYYTPEQLVGKSVIVVAGLQPAMLRGVESQGMMLAVGTGADVVLLTTEKPVPTGAQVT